MEGDGRRVILCGDHPRSCGCCSFAARAVRYCTPALVHKETYFPLQTLDFGVYWSLIGFATLLLVMATGVARIEGTFLWVCGSVTVTPLVSGTWPLASEAIALMAG